MRKSITFIELIIVLCVIVVSVRMWNQHKDSEAKTGGHTSRPTVNTTSDDKDSEGYSKTPCLKCGKTALICIYYNSGKCLAGKVCENCNGFFFKCPNCGSGDLYFTSYGISEKDGNTTGYVDAVCRVCRWESNESAYKPKIWSDEHYQPLYFHGGTGDTERTPKHSN